MFCSTIIPTIGRATLTRTVQSVLEQRFVDDTFEVIVVNDTGQPLPDADWHHSERVQVVTTNRHERSVARNTGAALAKGRYLHFLDDDDWLLPSALENLLALSRRSNADWLYGSAQLIDREERLLIQLHHCLNGNCFTQVMAGEWIPLQTSLIKADAFFAVGGFNPLISGPEDIDLCRRIALLGNIEGISTPIAYVGMGQTNSSTDHENSFKYSRWAREQIINLPDVFARLQDSATSSYWQGRIVRIYLTSVVWNLRRKNIFTAASRATFGIAALGMAGKHLFESKFWAAVSTQYLSETFARGFQESSTVQQKG